MSYEEVFKKLQEKYTIEEIADAMMIPAELTEEEEQASREALRQLRLKLQRERTEAEKIYYDMLRLRFLIEDYLKEKAFSPEKTFGKYLAEYIYAIRKTKKSFSEDIGIY